MGNKLPTPQARRRAKTEARLQASLERMRQAGVKYITVSMLSHESGVSRNAIYKSHRAILAHVQKLPPRKSRKIPLPVELPDSPDDPAQMKEKLKQLASQNAALLKRALDAERQVERLTRRTTELLRALNAGPGGAVLLNVEV